ncbi:MAG: hypothetical protein M1825_000506 [Sarcosagium campestre]|nr:MAG: hypothetical protein M1825_000506 [Sarcosagium campestre]
MPRNSSTKKRSQLDGSWVIQGHDDDIQGTPTPAGNLRSKRSQLQSPMSGGTRKIPARSSTRNTDSSAEPEFVMPSIDNDSVVGSWVEANQKANQEAAERPRRRVTNRRAQVASGNGSMHESRQSETLTYQEFPVRAPPATEIERNTSRDVSNALFHALGSTVSWAMEILGGALRVAKTPITLALGVMLAAYLLLGLGLVFKTVITHSIQSSFAPICRLPGASILPICPTGPITSVPAGPAPPVEFDQMMKVQSKFEEVLEESAGGVSLPLDMKRGETSMRDLRQLVRFSSLQSKNELVLEFDGFIDTARMASYDLQKYNSHIGRAVDSVLATTRWTMRVLDGIAMRDAAKGALNIFLADTVLAAFRSTGRSSESTVLDQYIQHTRVVEEEIRRLIIEAQALLQLLTNLEDRLDVIHGIVARDDEHAQATRDDTLARLWTLLGGNRGTLNRVDRQRALLAQVGQYRRSAFAHVSGTVLRLQDMQAGLEDLRDRVAAPELLRDRGPVHRLGVDVDGPDFPSDSPVVDVPLIVHLDNIQRGVERLEASRQSAKKLASSEMKRSLGRDGVSPEDHLIDAP